MKAILLIAKRILPILLVTFICFTSYSQQHSAGVNIDNPNPNAVLHLVSPFNDQGLLIPKMTTGERGTLAGVLIAKADAAADNGIMVYDSDENAFYFWVNNAWLKISEDQTLATLLANGNDADGSVIENVADPVGLQDVATKNYVDNQSDSDNQDLGSVLSFGSSANNTIITDAAEPLNPQDVATKNYVDSQGDADNQDLTSVLGFGNNAGNNTIEGVLNPLNPQDVATKDYVDIQPDNDNQTLTSVLSIDNGAGTLTIQDLGEPVNLQDAATKNYVDSQLGVVAINSVGSAEIIDGSITDVDISDVAVGKITGAPNLDIDSTDDFDGVFASLTGVPVNLDIDATDDLALATNPAAGDISGNYTSGFSVDNVGAQTAANVSTATGIVNGATNLDLDDTDDITTADVGTGVGQVLQFGVAATLPVLDGSALTGVTSANFSGALVGDVSGTQGATSVDNVGGQTAANVALATGVVNGATSLDLDDTDDITTADVGTGVGQVLQFGVAATLPVLDGSALTGVTSANFSGALVGDVSGTQGATSVDNVGGQTAANVALATGVVNGATSLDLDDTDDITTADVGTGVGQVLQFGVAATLPVLDGSALTGVTSANFSGALVGDVSGTQGATSVDNVGGQTAANIALATGVVNGATSLDLDDTDDITTADVGTGVGQVLQFGVAATLPVLDGSALTGVTSANFSGALVGDVSGTQGATSVDNVGGQTAANIALATGIVNGAPSLDLDDSDDVIDLTNPAAGDITGNFSTGLNIGAGTIANADLNKTNIPLSGFGAATAAIDAGTQVINNVGAPVAAADAATMGYVDGLAISSGNGVTIAGGNADLGGSLTSNATITTVSAVADLVVDGTGTLDVDSNLDVDSPGGITLDAQGPANFTTTAGNLDFSTFTSGSISVNSVQDLNLTAGASNSINLSGPTNFTGNIIGGSPLVFEGTTENTNETVFAITDPTAINTITFPDATGDVLLSSGALAPSLALTTNGSSQIVTADDVQPFSINSNTINLGNGAGDMVVVAGSFNATSNNGGNLLTVTNSNGSAGNAASFMSNGSTPVLQLTHTGGSQPGLTTNTGIVIGSLPTNIAGAIRFNGSTFEGNRDGLPTGWLDFAGLNFPVIGSDTDAGPLLTIDNTDGTTGNSASFISVSPTATVQMRNNNATGPVLELTQTSVGAPGLTSNTGIVIGSLPTNLPGAIRFNGSTFEGNFDGLPTGWLDFAGLNFPVIGSDTDAGPLLTIDNTDGTTGNSASFISVSPTATVQMRNNNATGPVLELTQTSVGAPGLTSNTGIVIGSLPTNLPGAIRFNGSTFEGNFDGLPTGWLDFAGLNFPVIGSDTDAGPLLTIDNTDGTTGNSASFISVSPTATVQMRNNNATGPVLELTQTLVGAPGLTSNTGIVIGSLPTNIAGAIRFNGSTFEGNVDGTLGGWTELSSTLVNDPGTENLVAGFAAGSGLLVGGVNNTMVGFNAGSGVTDGDNNVLIGRNAAFGITTGSGNVMLGSGTVANAASSNAIAIGSGAQVLADDAVAIGAGTVANTANTIILGDGVSTNFNVGIGTATPVTDLHIYNTLDQPKVLTLDAQGATAGQSAGLVLTTLGDGINDVNNAATNGWIMLGYGNTFGDVTRQNDLAFLSYTGAAETSNILHLDASGNVGVGTDDPMAPFQVGDNFGLSHFQNSTSAVDGEILSNNIYPDYTNAVDNDLRRLNTDPSSFIFLQDGEISFHTTPAGAANSTIDLMNDVDGWLDLNADGSIDVTGFDSDNPGTPGSNVSIVAGDGNTTGDGGVLTLRSGGNSDVGGNAGNIRLEPGLGTGAGINGGIDMRGITRFGQTGALPGSIEFEDNTGGALNVVEIRGPAATGGYTLTLPAAVSGVAGHALIDTDGAGNLGWAAAGGGDYTVSPNFNHVSGPGTGGSLGAGTNNILVGNNVGALVDIGTDNILIGRDIAPSLQGAAGSENIFIGLGSGDGIVNGSGNVNIGVRTRANGVDAVAIGTDASATSTYGVAVGNNTSASISAVALGRNASANSIAAIAIGFGALSDGTTISIGEAANAHTDGSIAIGGQATTEIGSGFAIAIGEFASADTEAITIGHNANTGAAEAIAIGYRATAANLNSIAIGGGTFNTNGAEANSNNSVAIGFDAAVQITAVNSIALGNDANVLSGANDAIAIGAHAFVPNPEGIAIGGGVLNNGGAEALGNRSIAIGFESTASSNGSIGFGEFAIASDVRAISIGFQADVQAGATNAIAVGSDVTAGAADAIAIGRSAAVNAASSVAIGRMTTIATGATNSVAVGDGITLPAAALNAVAIGSQSLSSTVEGIAIGYRARASSQNSIAIGGGLVNTNGAEANSNNSVAIGFDAQVQNTSNDAIAFGNATRVAAGAPDAIAMGRTATVNFTDGIAIGRQATVNAVNSVAIGAGVTVATANTIALGTVNETVRIDGTLVGTPAGPFGGGAALPSNSRVVQVNGGGIISEIVAGLDGQEIIIVTVVGGINITHFAGGSDNVRLNGGLDFVTSQAGSTLHLIYSTGFWVEISRSLQP